jgi:hypothetical protein
MTIEACEMTNIGSLGVCPDTESPPLALQVCQSKFGYFTEGSWENLLGCLGELPATYDQACDETSASDAVASCLADVVREACPDPEVDAMCESLGESCQAFGQEFSVDNCKKALAPLSDASIASYTACTDRAFGRGAVMCSGLHSDCFGSIGISP